MKKLVFAATYLFVVFATLGGVQASAILVQYGAVSNGNCVCKNRCNYGTSIFSPGRSVGQCRQACRVAYSGCMAGEIRDTRRRDY